jgi:hypothetical protein
MRPVQPVHLGHHGDLPIQDALTAEMAIERAGVSQGYTREKHRGETQKL